MSVYRIFKKCLDTKCITLSENNYLILIICNGFIGIFNLDTHNSTCTMVKVQFDDDKL